MAELRNKSLSDPDETAQLPLVHMDVVDLGDWTVARAIHEPGWRWSTHIKPKIGGDWCQVRHVGVVIRGRLGIEMQDGTTIEFGPYDVMDVPPGHDGWVIGDEPVELIEWAGVRAWAGFTGSSRVLATVLFTDLVGSTEKLSEIGDAAWRELLSGHFQIVRSKLERYGGREVKNTGDGILATFGGPAQALLCADEIGKAARRDGLAVRAAVHVGEIEMVGDDVRGVAIHEAARIMSKAGADEILVSDITRVLASTSGLQFEDRGTHELKGLAGEWPLFAFAAEASSLKP